MRPFLPPETRELTSRIVARNARRAGRQCAALEVVAGTGERREALRALDATLGALRGPARTEFFFSPAVRGWLRASEEALALARPGAGLTDLDLFDRIARGPHLRELLPRGRLDREFRRRASALGEGMLRRAFAKLPVLLAALTPSGAEFGPFTLDAAADGEEARRTGEIHFDRPVPSTLAFRGRLRLTLVPGDVRFHRRDPAPTRRLRELIDGSRIVLTRRVVSTRRGLRPGAHVRGLAPRLGRALALVRLAWPEGFEEILAHTRIVTPLTERGTVSYSLPDLPGVSFINVGGKSLVDLADDLLHETAHHRLHGLEEIAGPLDRDDGEPRYHSPWRRGIRPLHGILHANYTFTWRAELLRRLLALADRRETGLRLSRTWLRRELDKELAALRRSSRDLLDAERLHLLTRSGIEISEALAARVGWIQRRRSTSSRASL
jgi:HEXXH motif-containing protein